MNRLELYQRLPVPAQHVAATGYGARELVRRHGGAYRRFREDLRARQWWTPERLAADADVRVHAMAVWSGARVPYYRDLFRSLGITGNDVRGVRDLDLLPVLDKETVRAEPERFLPDPPRPRLIPQTTGGTTGTPLAYWATLDAVRFNYATYEERCRGWAGVRLGARMASFQGQPVVPATVQDPPFWRRNPAFNQLYCSVYHLNDTTLPAYVDELERFDPQVVVGYTSAVHRVASHLLERGQVGRIRPRAVLVSSETLFPGSRADMEAAFGCPVWNSYSLGELVAYVSQCPQGHLHVSTEYGALELLDLDGSGRTEIVATGLINRGMPLLRYRTGDLAQGLDLATAPCGRGLPTLEQVLGRADDVVRTPEGSVVGPAPMSLAFQRVAHLRRAQVRQERVEAIEVLVEVTPGWSAADADFLVAELRRRLGSALSISLEVVDRVPPTSGGKERLVVSTLARAGREDPS